MLSHNTTGAPCPRNGPQVVALFWEWVRLRAVQRHTQRERAERWNEPRKYISPATCLPFTLQCHRRLGLCGFTDAQMFSGARAFNLASESRDHYSTQFCFSFVHKTWRRFSLNSNTYSITDDASALIATRCSQHSEVHLHQRTGTDCDFRQ